MELAVLGRETGTYYPGTKYILSGDSSLRHLVKVQRSVINSPDLFGTGLSTMQMNPGLG